MRQVDILFNFRTAYMHEEEQIVVIDERKIALRYFKGWFWIDVCACFPVGYISLALDPEHDHAERTTSTKALKTARLLRLGKLLRLARIWVANYRSSNPMKKMIRLIIIAKKTACFIRTRGV